MLVGNGLATEYNIINSYRFLDCLHEINVSTKAIDLLSK